MTTDINLESKVAGTAATARTWNTVAVAGPLATTLQTSLSYKDGVFSALSSGGAYYSTDALNWTSLSTGATLPVTTASMTTCLTVVGNGIILNLTSSSATTTAYVIASIIPITTNATALVLTDSDTGSTLLTPTNNLVTKKRLYLGEFYSGNLINYSYRGEYLSDWFPVIVNATYLKNHNIGTGSVTTDTFFNKFKSDVASYEVDAGSLTSANYNSTTTITTNTFYGYGCQTMSIDQNNVIIRTGTNRVDYSTNVFTYTASDFGGATTGYYRIKVSRSW
jgi:hypothetical protein